MKVIFKDVGQGDSIILEWASERGVAIGIIDCNKRNSKENPVVEYIAGTSFDVIEFVLLTHPHYDHFSGMNSLLDYCESNSLTIDKFFHTCQSVPQFLLSSVQGHVAKSELDRLFLKLQSFSEKGLIGEIFQVNSNSRELDLGKEAKLKFLAPTSNEFHWFNRNIYKAKLEVKQNSSIANILSTFIKIYKQGEQVLLTSDLFEHILAREVGNGFGDTGETARLVQVPHHGAKDNFSREFFNKLNHNSSTISAISVGENDYGHPSQYVLKKLNDYGYDIKTTADVLSTAKPLVVSSTLDMISENVSATVKSKNNDIIFNF